MRSLENDGWRCLAFVGRTAVQLQSRHRRALAPYFPDLVALLQDSLPTGTVVDGEIISWDQQHGRTDFAALSRRITAGRRLPVEAAAHPAGLVAFDVLQDRGRSLLDQPLIERRAVLAGLLDATGGSIPLCPATLDPEEALQWAEDWAPTGSEGLLIKDLSSRYRPGRSTGWWKWRRRISAEAIIGGVLGAWDRPAGLLLGRYSSTGTFRYVGRTTSPTPELASELATLLTPATGGHPWPRPLPAGWTGRFDRREPQLYLPVDPSLVLEITVDAAYGNGRWRHPVRPLRIRVDLALGDVALHQWDQLAEDAVATDPG